MQVEPLGLRIAIVSASEKSLDSMDLRTAGCIELPELQLALRRRLGCPSCEDSRSEERREHL